MSEHEAIAFKMPKFSEQDAENATHMSTIDFPITVCVTLLGKIW
jgi:hypothetical protein